MSFPRYPEYKDSGVEWLGEVPRHWEVKRIKTLAARISSGKTPLGGSEVYVDEGITFLRSQNVYDEGLRVDDVAFISEAVDATMAVSRVVVGDILLNITGASIGRSCVVPDGFSPANVNQHVCVIRATKPSYIPFLGWSLKSAPIKSQIDHAQNGAAREGLNFDQIGRMVSALPPAQEQSQIAAFLDRETAKIDALVAEQRRLMALLKEKRQAVISHAVTRGLNPHAPMKPSGIEWLGDVPEHWEVIPLKYVVRLRSGGTPSKTNTAYWDGDVPWASSKDLKVETLSDTQDHITQKAVDDGAADLVPAGSLLIVVRGMILIHTFPVVKALIPMAINQDLKALTPSAKLDVDFLAWLLRGASKETLGRIDEAAHGTKVLRLEAWTSIALPIPPVTEQLVIVRAISESMRQFDTLTTEAQRAIDLLQERRTALISAAVTGQIDVRGAV